MIYVHNESGSTISNATAVYLSSAASPDGNMHIKVASNDLSDAYSTIAITTNSIANGSYGYCTKIGKVRDLNTVGLTEGAKIYLGTNGAIISTKPSFPAHVVELGYCVVSHATSGVIFVDVNNQFAVEDLYNVKITNPSEGDSFIYENNRWINRNFGAITREATGFADPDSITVTYNSASRTISLTGTSIAAYYRSNLVPALSGSSWTSTAHALNPTSMLFLYYDGAAFQWSTTPWSFDALHIATVMFSNSGNFLGAVREIHGTMQWQVHRELHQTIGTYLGAGGDLSSFVLNSTTPANRRPDIASSTLYDEDLKTINAALTDKSYSIFTLSGTGYRNVSINNTDIIPLSTNQPYYNQFNGSAWVQTLMQNNEFACIFVMAQPMASDTVSQKNRYLFVQPQASFASLDLANSVSVGSINLGDLPSGNTEFTYIAKIIVKYQGGDWSIVSTEKLLGSKLNQTSTTGNYLSTVAHDLTLSGDGTSISPLTVVSASIWTNQIASISADVANKLYTSAAFTKTSADTLYATKTSVSEISADVANKLYTSAAFTKTSADTLYTPIAHNTRTDNPHSVTKTQVGLSAVTNDAQVKRTEMGVANGVATLGSDGKIPTSQYGPAAITEIS